MCSRKSLFRIYVLLKANIIRFTFKKAESFQILLIFNVIRKYSLFILGIAARLKTSLRNSLSQN